MTKVAVTGASGAIGSALLVRLSTENCFEVIGLSRSDRSHESRGNINWQQTDYSFNSLNHILKDVSLVMHLAGVKGDKTEMSDFDEDFKMSENLLKASIENNVRRIVYTSSRLVYGNPNEVPWSETDSLNPSTAYGKNKVRTEELFRKHSGVNDIDVKIIRVAQVISNKDRMRNMMTVFRELSETESSLKVIGKSVSRRQYIYAPDLAELIVIISNIKKRGFDIVNAGMLQSYTNYEIALTFNRAYNNPTAISYDDSVPETVAPSRMDVSRMLEMTGFVPRDMYCALQDMASSGNS